MPKQNKTSSLFVGFAKNDVTPSKQTGVHLAGFDFERLSTGIRDPLSVRALSFEKNGRELNLAVVDLIGFPLDEVNRVRRLLPEEAAKNTIIAATHVHSGPDALGFWGKGVFGLLPVTSGLEREYLDEAAPKIASAIEAARNNRRPASLALYKASLPYPGVIENIREPGNFDRALSVVAAKESGSGKMIAALMHFGCHPETLWNDNKRVSSDFVGPLCEELSSELKAFAMFANGALGGMVTPDISMKAKLPEREEFLNRVVKSLKESVYAALAAEGTPLEGEISSKRSRVALVNSNWRFKLLNKIGVFARETSDISLLNTEITLANLCGLPLVGLPGEPLPAVGYEVKSRLGDPDALVLGLANDELGYILPKGHFRSRLYKYEQTMSVGPNMAPQLMAALESLK